MVGWELEAYQAVEVVRLTSVLVLLYEVEVHEREWVQKTRANENLQRSRTVQQSDEEHSACHLVVEEDAARLIAFGEEDVIEEEAGRTIALYEAGRHEEFEEVGQHRAYDA